ncbi:dihydroorotase [Desulfovibrio ferrophilus]|uniref:Dihydroorotase n=1 Tax=Desulfovibrio ferrophilus TaxID=241368 RepID=A0A2Z6B1Z6_9BACT|nr:dihydroorotase [Desulfovibrio ferrophilus]BBD09501.1 dihydroorotase, multifunctional complex type [Desulfovibrio ferrophilus]
MSNPDFVIRGAKWQGEAMDLLVADGKIMEMRPTGGSIAEGVEKIPANGALLLPALTDAHVHLREPGFEWKEDIASGLLAAAHGGFANIMCMANTDPVNDEVSVTEMMLDKARLAWPDGPRLFPVAGLTKGLKGQQLTNLAEMHRAGCKAASNDGLPVHNTELFRNAVEYAANWGMVVIDHCEDPDMAPGAGVNEGELSSRLGLKGAPTAGEAIQVARDILLAQYLDTPIHVAHVSCRQAVEMLADAKRRGVPITAETCPHYLLLTEDAVEGYDTAAKVNPPLRTMDDVLAIRQALNEGVIDILVTDHAPHADHEKEVPFAEAPCGISGLDTALPLTMRMVDEGILDMETAIRAWCLRPAEIFGLPSCGFAAGDSADFVLYDPSASWEVRPELMRSKGKNTPFMGQTMPGRVNALFVGGRRIV